MQSFTITCNQSKLLQLRRSDIIVTIEMNMIVKPRRAGMIVECKIIRQILCKPLLCARF